MNIAMPPRKRPPPPVVFTTSTRAIARVVLGSSSIYPTLDLSPDPAVDTPLDTPLDAPLGSPLGSPLDLPLDPPLDPNTTVVGSTQKEKKTSLIWTDIMEETMFDALLDQDRRGKRADVGFKSEAWTLVREAVQQVYIRRLSIEVLQLKSRESNYKALYKDWKWLKEQSGFGQDPETSLITASKESWIKVIRTRKSCGWHRYNVLKYTDLL
jgi:hypothetical protein